MLGLITVWLYVYHFLYYTTLVKRLSYLHGESPPLWMYTWTPHPSECTLFLYIKSQSRMFMEKKGFTFPGWHVTKCGWLSNSCSATILQCSKFVCSNHTQKLLLSSLRARFSNHAPIMLETLASFNFLIPNYKCHHRGTSHNHQNVNNFPTLRCDEMLYLNRHKC